MYCRPRMKYATSPEIAAYVTPSNTGMRRFPESNAIANSRPACGDARLSSDMSARKHVRFTNRDGDCRAPFLRTSYVRHVAITIETGLLQGGLNRGRTVLVTP